MSTKAVVEPAGELEPADILRDARVAIVGKLAGMSRRDAQQLIRARGGVAVESPAADVQIVVIGEQEFPLAADNRGIELDDATRLAVDEGRIEVISETQLWQRLGLVEAQQHVHRLYTPAMLAELLQVPLAIVRRWHRRGLIVPSREVRRLPYFDFQEVATARRLAELLAAGMSPQAIEKKLAELGRYVPNIERPLAQLSVIVEGKQLLLRQGDGLIAPGGQHWFDFQAEGQEASARSAVAQDELPVEKGETASGARQPLAVSPLSEQSDSAAVLPWPTAGAISSAASPPDIDELLDRAVRLDDDGELAPAAEMYRAALAAGGPNAQVCFALAELLYRLGDVTAARERYFMAIELDEEYVEARANLGCVLAELGDRELAVAAFQGALAFHDQYPDVHYHLARTLDDLAQRAEADGHWRAFLELAPSSPWAATARRRLAEDLG